MKRLGVSAQTLEKFGPVSQETAKEMAEGIARTSGASIGIATTGVAGPDGGTEEKPVGLVYIGIYNNGAVEARGFHFAGNRNKIRERATFQALDWLRRKLQYEK